MGYRKVGLGWLERVHGTSGGRVLGGGLPGTAGWPAPCQPRVQHAPPAPNLSRPCLPGLFEGERVHLVQAGRKQWEVRQFIADVPQHAPPNESVDRGAAHALRRNIVIVFESCSRRTAQPTMQAHQAQRVQGVRRRRRSPLRRATRCLTWRATRRKRTKSAQHLLGLRLRKFTCCNLGSNHPRISIE